MGKYHIVSIGDLVLDIIFPVTLPIEANVHQDPPTRRIEPGGAGNFMFAARHMGLKVTAAGAVGYDPFGSTVLTSLREAGVKTQFVNARPGTTTTIVIVLSDQATGQHTFVGNYGEGPEVLYPEGLDACINSADAVYLQGYTLAEPRVIPMAIRAGDHAAAAGVPVYVDVGPFMRHVTPELRAWAIERADCILMTEEEIPLIAKDQTGDDGCAFLLEAGVSVVVVKRGAEGCSIMTSEKTEHIPGYPVPVVDTAGAGDCFGAAFLAGRLHDLALKQCGQLGNAMGAACVQRLGAGSNAPTCDEVLTLLHSHGDKVNFSC